jgi:hypothetical protein
VEDDADAGGYDQLLALDDKGLQERGVDAIGDLLGLVGRADLFDDDNELIPTVAGDGVTGTKTVLDPFRSATSS